MKQSLRRRIAMFLAMIMMLTNMSFNIMGTANYPQVMLENNLLSSDLNTEEESTKSHTVDIIESHITTDSEIQIEDNITTGSVLRIDFTKLQALIEEAKKIDRVRYTEESVKALESVLKQVETLIEQYQLEKVELHSEHQVLTQEKVDEAYLLLQSALEQLIEKETQEAIFVVERSTLGQPFYIEPTVVEFYEGESVAHALIRILGDNNYNYGTNWDFKSSFYLAEVKLEDSLPVNVPQHIIDMGFDPSGLTGNSDEWLGQFDYNSMSGWMYIVNHVMPNVGMDNELLKPDDVVRVQFTLHGYGEDLGFGWGESSTYIPANKDELMRELAYINEEPSVLENNQKLKAAYDNGMNLAMDMSASQEDVDQAVEHLEKGFVLDRKVLDSTWPLFRGNKENLAVVDYKLPTPGDQIETKWIQEYGTGWSGNGKASIIVDNHLYIVGDNKLQKRNMSDGAIVAETAIPNGIDFYSNLGYAEGTVYVPSAKGTITAFNAKTLDFEWTSESVGNYQNLSAIQYHNGLVYAGFTSGGTFAAFEGDTGKVKWKYNEGTSYYQTGAVVVGENIIFAGDDGKLASVNAQTGEETAIKELEGGVRCIPVKEGEYIYLTTKAGYIYKIQVNEDGTFGEVKSYQGTTLGTTSPVVYNGRVYVGLGGMGTGGSVIVLNSEDMTSIYTVDLPGPTQSSPVLTTAYASEANHQKVYVYFTLNNANGTIMCLEDDSTKTEGKVSELYVPNPKQYSMSSLVAGIDGTLYYTNDSGNLFAIGTSVSKNLLNQLIAYTKEIDESLYTQESIIALKSALEHAEEVSHNTSAIQLDVDQAAEKLQSAINGLQVQPKPSPGDYRMALDKTFKYIVTANPTPKLLDEWNILALSRGAYTALESNMPAYYETYYKNLADTIIEKQGILSTSKYTEYSRVILALTAIGKNVENVGGYNLLEKMADLEQVKKQGINGPIFSLIAINSADYEIPVIEGVGTQNSEEKMVDLILEKEISGGGWALFGTKADPDITAMTIQALAPYYLQGNHEVKAAVDRALEVLSNLQEPDGDYASWGTVNVESTAQVLVALCELGIDPLKDSRFIKNDNTLIDGIMKYYVEGGGFKHVIDKGVDAKATEQSAYALVAYDRLVNGKTSLYNMTDVTFDVDKTSLLLQIKNAESKEEVEYTSKSWQVMEQALIKAKKVNSNPTAKQSEIDRVAQELEKAINHLEKAEAIKLPVQEDGTVQIPQNSNQNYEVEMPSDKSVEISIPETSNGKVSIIIEPQKVIKEVKAIKGHNEIKFPEGTKITKGSEKLQLFGTKTDEQKYQIQNDLKQLLTQTNHKVKSVKVDEAFKFGEVSTIQFNQFVEIKFAKMAGKRAAYIDDSGINLIEKVSSDADRQYMNEYAVDKGDDLVIYTNHFTDFIVYSTEEENGTGGGEIPPTEGVVVTLSIDKLTINKGYVIAPTTVKINKGETVWDVLKREMDNRGIAYEFEESGEFGSIYVQSIAGDGEFDHGPLSGWMYNVDGIYPNYGCSKYILSGGENIQWRYTTNLGEDLGQDNSEWLPNKPEIDNPEPNKPEINKPELQQKEEGSLTLKSETTLSNGELQANISKEQIETAIKEVLDNQLTEITIQPEIEDGAEFNKITVILEKESLNQIYQETTADLTMEMAIATVKLSHEDFAELVKEKGDTVTFSVEKNQDGTFNIEVKVGTTQILKLPSGIMVEIPVQEPTSSTIVVQIMKDEAERIIVQSIAQGDTIKVKLEGTATIKVVENKKVFKDSVDHWAQDAIDYLTSRELLKGTSISEFSPGKTMTKAMLVTLLHRLDGEKLVEGKAYTDINQGAYYNNAAHWAVANGIAYPESDTHFAPNTVITREQLAVMIYNYAKYIGLDGEEISDVSMKQFIDWGQVSEDAQLAMKYCYDKGIMIGKTETQLAPQGMTTRAEVATIIERFMRLALN